MLPVLQVQRTHTCRGRRTASTNHEVAVRVSHRQRPRDRHRAMHVDDRVRAIRCRVRRAGQRGRDTGIGVLTRAILEWLVDDVLGLSVAGLPVRDPVFPAA